MASHVDPGQSILTIHFRSGYEIEWICQVRTSSQTGMMIFSFLAGATEIPQIALDFMIADLVKRSPKLGAIHLVAEVDHKNPILEGFRTSGFGISAWQDIWQIPKPQASDLHTTPSWEWCPLAEVDWWQIEQFLHAIIPPISQVTDLPSRYQSRYWVCHEKEKIIAFAEIRYGPQGIWIQPTFDPGVSRCPDMLTDLIRCLPAKLTRPIYLSVRSYQSWLFRSIELMGADYVSHQAILIKHLAGYVKELNPVDLLVIKNRKPKTSPPSCLPAQSVNDVYGLE